MIHRFLTSLPRDCSSPEICVFKDGDCGGGLVARADAGSDSEDSPGAMPPKPAFTALTLRPAAAATARMANGGRSAALETPSKARPPVTQVLPLEPHRPSARAHHPCAPWFRPDKGAIEPRPSRRSLSAALTDELLLPDRRVVDALSDYAVVAVHTPQVLHARLWDLPICGSLPLRARCIDHTTCWHALASGVATQLLAMVPAL